MLGIAIGIIPIIFVLVAVAGVNGDLDVKTYYNPLVVPNAKDSRKTLSTSAPVVLKININGMIGSEFLNMHTVKRQLTESREGKLKKDRVKAILIHINSPGGTVTDSNGIYTAIKEYKERYNVPVYAYVDGICASGGVYIACAADKIYATDISLIGSVGVLMNPFFNVTQLMEKVGVESKTITAGKGKDAMNPFRTWQPGEDDTFKLITESMYQHFLKVVTTNRPQMSRAHLINDFGANIFPAAKATEIGFIDGVTESLHETLDLLAQQLGIEDDFYQVVEMESKYWFANLMKSQSPLITGTLKHDLSMNTEALTNFYYLYKP